MTKDASDFGFELRVFLSQTYNLKAIADYETGPGSEISADRAKDAIEAADRFITYFDSLLKKI